MEDLTKKLTEQILSNIQSKTENVLKAEMISRHLSVADVKMICMNDENLTDLFIDMKRQRIFLKRSLITNPFKFESKFQSGMELSLEVVDEPVPEVLFRNLIAVSDVKFTWVYAEGSRGYYYIPFNETHDLVRVVWKRDNVWSIEVVGVMKEHIGGYGLEDVNAVLKIAESRVYETIDNIQEVIKRSLKK